MCVPHAVCACMRGHVRLLAGGACGEGMCGWGETVWLLHLGERVGWRGKHVVEQPTGFSHGSPIVARRTSGKPTSHKSLSVSREDVGPKWSCDQNGLVCSKRGDSAGGLVPRMLSQNGLVCALHGHSSGGLVPEDVEPKQSSASQILGRPTSRKSLILVLRRTFWVERPTAHGILPRSPIVAGRTLDRPMCLGAVG